MNLFIYILLYFAHNNLQYAHKLLFMKLQLMHIDLNFNYIIFCLTSCNLPLSLCLGNFVMIFLELLISTTDKAQDFEDPLLHAFLKHLQNSIF